MIYLVVLLLFGSFTLAAENGSPHSAESALLQTNSSLWIKNDRWELAQATSETMEHSASAVKPVPRSKAIHFSGYTWVVRPNGRGGPGPNNWSQDNVFLDANGWLHLKLTQQDGRWYGAEAYTQTRLGFGTYEFWLECSVDQLDRNVVVGLFNYPTADVGPDGTHEIDIEFAQWGQPNAPHGNYTVWPATSKKKQTTKSYSFSLDHSLSTHCFDWKPASILFQSYQGEPGHPNQPFARWLYKPYDPAASISQRPMPVHINLWCFQGRPPHNGEPVELVVRAFKFTPLKSD